MSNIQEPNFSYGAIEKIYKHFITIQNDFGLKVTPEQVKEIRDKGTQGADLSFDLDVGDMLKSMFASGNVNVVLSAVYGTSDAEIKGMDIEKVAEMFSAIEDQLKKKLLEFIELNKSVYGLAGN